MCSPNWFLDYRVFRSYFHGEFMHEVVCISTRGSSKKIHCIVYIGSYTGDITAPLDTWLDSINVWYMD